MLGFLRRACGRTGGASGTRLVIRTVGGRLDIRDAEPIRLVVKTGNVRGSGCQRFNARHVRCPVPDPEAFSGFSLGDRDDRLTDSSGASFAVDGGLGDDVLEGGEVITRGAGARCPARPQRFRRAGS